MARLLIIDDDKSFRKALAESVQDYGHEVRGNRAEAARLLRRNL